MGTFKQSSSQSDIGNHYTEKYGDTVYYLKDLSSSIVVLTLTSKAASWRTVLYPFGLPGVWGRVIVPEMNGYNAPI